MGKPAPHTLTLTERERLNRKSRLSETFHMLICMSAVLPFNMSSGTPLSPWSSQATESDKEKKRTKTVKRKNSRERGREGEGERTKRKKGNKKGGEGQKSNAEREAREDIDQESELITTHAWVENRQCFGWCNCDSILRRSSSKLHHWTQEEETKGGKENGQKNKKKRKTSKKKTDKGGLSVSVRLYVRCQ